MVKHMKLKAIQESNTGLNTQFKNVDTGRTFSREHVINQINNGNPNYNNYTTVTNSKGTTFVRSKPDGNTKNNLE